MCWLCGLNGKSWFVFGGWLVCELVVYVCWLGFWFCCGLVLGIFMVEKWVCW